MSLSNSLRYSYIYPRASGDPSRYEGVFCLTRAAGEGVVNADAPKNSVFDNESILLCVLFIA